MFHINPAPTHALEAHNHAILVHVDFDKRTTEPEILSEFKALALSSGAKILEIFSVFLRKPHAKYLIGEGKVEEIAQAIPFHQADLVIFNHILSPSQERNLERFFKCRVLDRTGLILDIFAARARTFEGRLQVELAQLQYLLPRLVRSWTHLERQRGGIGLRGPGETQLELDKRLINQRIKAIKRQLEKVRGQRRQGRQSRKRANIPIVSLVGYTNAGKSTLFNQLTQSSVYTADQLFATLDPTLRRIEVPTIGTVILVDTVGFIRDIPHQLIEAFHATLEETQQADLLLHVVDASSFYRRDFIQIVNDVLKEIEADQVPQLLVYNKTDQLPEHEIGMRRNEQGKICEVWVSALKKQGLDILQQVIGACLQQEMVSAYLNIPPEASKLRAAFHNQQAIISETINSAGGWNLHIRMRKSDYGQLKKQYPAILPNL